MPFFINLRPNPDQLEQAKNEAIRDFLRALHHYLDPRHTVKGFNTIDPWKLGHELADMLNLALKRAIQSEDQLHVLQRDYQTTYLRLQQLEALSDIQQLHALQDELVTLKPKLTSLTQERDQAKLVCQAQAAQIERLNQALVRASIRKEK